MKVSLEIRDGNPWWLSPDIWTVPGNDPEGAPGLPVAGQPCYLWAQVRNNGANAVENATVRFYWGNPNVGFDRTTANPIGTAFVTLNPGEVQNVLCLTPWVPVFVNEGHECVLAEAFHPVDPLPPSNAFNVSNDRHVAQRNLTVLLAAKAYFHVAFEVHNTARTPRIFRISTKLGDVEALRPLAPTLGQRVSIPAKLGAPAYVGFTQSPCPDPAEIERSPSSIEEVRIGPNGRVGFSLVGRLAGEPALIHVVQHCDGRMVGGLSVLVTDTERA